MRHWVMGKYRDVCSLCGEEARPDDLAKYPTDLCPRCVNEVIPALAKFAIERVKKAKGRYRKQPWREIQDDLYPRWPKRD